MGICGAAVSELVLIDVRVPETAILGKLGEGFKIAMMGLDGGHGKMEGLGGSMPLL